VRQEGKRSFRWKQESNGRATNWEDTNQWQSSQSERWDFQVEWENSNWDSDAFESNEHWDETGNSETGGKTCEYFQSGYCHWGSSCYFSHDWNGTNENGENEQFVASNIPAGVVFLLDGEAAEVMGGEGLRLLPLDGTGPLRLRIVGDIEELGFSEGKWDPNLGVDLCWEGDGWRSMVIKVSPESFFHFCVVRVDQPESHPGLLQGWARWEMHTARHFTWSQTYGLRAPCSNEILQVYLKAHHCRGHNSEVAVLNTRKLPRHAVTTAPGRPFWQPPGMRCFTFDGPEGFILKYCLYLPDTSRMQEPLSLVLFLHSMHGKLEGDNNLFFESDTPLRLLLDEDDERCPRSLRERCIFLAPQCPTDRERGDGAGIWLRKGWYEESDYDQQAENALMALVEMIRAQYGLKRVSMCGSSMGAYGALELTSRRPNFFSAVALIAAHYDLDPIEPLVTRLTEKQEVPLWFIHAENDNVCPFPEMEELVHQLRARSRAEVYMTSFEDTWSSQGHCADCVAFWSRPIVPGALALGDKLFEWLNG